jgi:MFS transporter, DHA1 family, tetracycline resistance protein
MAEKKAGKASLVFIFITVLVDVMGLAIIIPVLPTLIQELTGEGLSKAAEYGGLMMMAFASTQFLFAPLMGELSDRFGRRPVLLLALTGLGIDYLFHAFAPTIGLLLLSRVIAGIFGSSHTVAAAYIADISSSENKAKNFGMLGAAFSVGFIIGPFIGGVCAQWGYQVPFIVAACLSLLNVLFGLFVLPESLPKEKRRKIKAVKAIPFVSLAHLGKYKALLLFIIAFTMTYLAGQVLPSTWSFFTMEAYSWSDKEVGYSLAVVGILVGTAQGFLVGRSVKKFGNKQVIIGGFLLWTFGMFAFAFASNGFLLYAALIPYALGATASPVIQGIMSNAVPGDEQGNLQGALTSLISITAIMGPLLFTGIFKVYTEPGAETYFPGSSFLVAGIILVFSTFLVLIALKKMKNMLSDEVKDAPSESDE